MRAAAAALEKRRFLDALHDLRYHRGVHSCALWPRARVKSLTRTLSGCGSVDFSHSSPNAARRASTTFASPDDARDSPRATRKPQEHIAGAGAVAGAVPPLAAADDLLVSEGDAAADSISGGISPTRGHDKGGQKWAVPDRENLDKAGSPILGSGAGGDAGGGVFWSGPAMGAGVLVSPGMQLTVEGGEEGQQGIGLGGARTRRRSRSSIGSVSLASVLCDSPSEVGMILVLCKMLAKGCMICFSMEESSKRNTDTRPAEIYLACLCIRQPCVHTG